MTMNGFPALQVGMIFSFPSATWERGNKLPHVRITRTLAFAFAGAAGALRVGLIGFSWLSPVASRTVEKDFVGFLRVGDFEAGFFGMAATSHGPRREGKGNPRAGRRLTPA
jgi:hypothetical protein